MYLKQLTAAHLITSVVRKCGFDAAAGTVSKAFHVDSQGALHAVDNEFVRNIAPEQDMRIEILLASTNLDVATKRNSLHNSPGGEDGLEWHLRLNF